MTQSHLVVPQGGGGKKKARERVLLTSETEFWFQQFWSPKGRTDLFSSESWVLVVFHILLNMASISAPCAIGL